jgi:hypothetical protein
MEEVTQVRGHSVRIPLDLGITEQALVSIRAIVPATPATSSEHPVIGAHRSHFPASCRFCTRSTTRSQ